MSPLAQALALAVAASLSLPLGALLARREHIARPALRREVHEGATAFGGGALMAAVALVLVPQGAARLGPGAALAAFVIGGLVVFAIDRMLGQRGGGLAVMVAMLLDFLPEAMALGALLAGEGGTAALLAAMIFVQNVPESYASWHGLGRAGIAPGTALALIFGLAALGPLCALAGLALLSDMPALLGAIMLGASGGILYLLFQDIAPETREPAHGRPALGAVLGFALGLGGDMLLT